MSVFPLSIYSGDLAARSAGIVRRRLEQAGYGAADGLDFFGGDDLTFLLKFVYKFSYPSLCTPTPIL